MSALATLCGDRSKSIGIGDSSMAEDDGGFDPLYVSNVKRPRIEEPDEVCRTRSFTSVPSTLTGSVPNSPSVHEFDRPRFAWMTYWPGGTFVNSNTPFGMIRAPAGTLVAVVDR